MTSPTDMDEARHPLDPLNWAEIRQVTAILRRDRGVNESWRYASIELREPGKDAVRAYRPGAEISREARVVCWNREQTRTFRARVSLSLDAVLDWDEVPDEQPNMTVDEWHEAHEMLIAHPEVIAVLAARGITDMNSVLMDTWAYGHALIPSQFRNRRVGWTDTWVRESPTGSFPAVFRPDPPS